MLGANCKFCDEANFLNLFDTSKQHPLPTYSNMFPPLHHEHRDTVVQVGSVVNTKPQDVFLGAE